jgi:hypothetical protein
MAALARSRPAPCSAAALLSLLLILLAARNAAARVVQVPEGGRAVQVVREGVVCGPLPQGWGLDSDRRSVRPPSGEGTWSRQVDLKIAPSTDACDKSKDRVTVVAIGAYPDIDPASVVFAADEGRLELKGQRLKGMQIWWQAGQKSGKDSCLDPTPSGKLQQCVIPVAVGLPLDAVLHALPAGAVLGEDAVFHDANGDRVDLAQLVLRPARFLVTQLVPPSASVDVSTGPGRVPLVHPQAVTSVDCGLARCELADNAIVVRSVPAPATNVTFRLRLAPRVVLMKGEAQETQTTLTLPLLQCPLAIASGPPLRDADDSQIIVRLDQRCAKEARLRWVVNGEPAEVARPMVRTNEAGFVLLRVGRLLGDRVTVTATRGDLDATIIGTVSSKSVAAPRARASLELPGHGKVEFIPTNRDAILSLAAIGEHARLVPLSVDGAYDVRADKGRYLVRGDENAGGFVSLRFGYRVDNLPSELAGTDLAVISERTQRAVREASVPAPFSVTAAGEEPLTEFVCSDDEGQPKRLAPSKPYKLSYEARSTCRVVIHRERIRPEFGLQEILLEVEVTSAQGRRRPEASFSERMILVPGADTRVVPLKGGIDEFDQILVRISHVLDETRYALSPTSRSGLPSVQWTARVEGGNFRLYATAAIPAGLYRMNEPTGQLTLNFGVLSRVTYLDDRGKESLLGAEIGLMGMGLIQRPGSTEYPPTLGAIAGLGIRVPLGDGGAAVGVHVWGVYEFREKLSYVKDERGRAVTCPKGAACETASRFALIFGPSISIGNVGTNF